MSTLFHTQVCHLLGVLMLILEYILTYPYSSSDTDFKSFGHQCHWTPQVFKITTCITKKTTLKWFKHQL